MYRQALARQARLFSTSVYLRKGPVDVAKDAAKTVDRTISDAAVKGIEKGEEATAKAKEVAGVGANKAQEVAGEAKDKAQEAKNEAAKKV